MINLSTERVRVNRDFFYGSRDAYVDVKHWYYMTYELTPQAGWPVNGAFICDSLVATVRVFDLHPVICAALLPRRGKSITPIVALFDHPTHRHLAG